MIPSLKVKCAKALSGKLMVIRNDGGCGLYKSLTPSLIVVVEKVVPLHQSVSSISTCGEATAELTGLLRNRNPYALCDLPVLLEALDWFQILFAEILLKLLQRKNCPIGIVRCCGIRRWSNGLLSSRQTHRVSLT